MTTGNVPKRPVVGWIGAGRIGRPKVERVLRHGYSRMILKDLDLMLDAARECGVPMPVTALTRQLPQGTALRLDVRFKDGPRTLDSRFLSIWIVQDGKPSHLAWHSTPILE